MAATIDEVQPVLMATDVANSIAFYESLGFTLVFVDAPERPRYAAVRRDGVELHLQWHAEADFSNGDRPTYRFVVPEVDQLSEEFERRRPDLDRNEVRDTAWGTREFHVRDLDRNGLQFYRALG